MADIYQQIWNADQEGNGLKAIEKGTAIDEATKDRGYVVVDDIDEAEAENEAHHLIVEVSIPDNKKQSYELAEKLFNNYTLDQTKPEINTQEEDQEIQDFIAAIVNTKPMLVAREFASRQSGEDITSDQWWNILQRAWFEQFNIGNNKDLSGFEHVIVGEQKQGTVQGYHFWYKYYLDERFLFNNQEFDLIDFEGLRGERESSPEVVTLSFVWKAFDFQKKQFRHLRKPLGGFWVGPSVEGIMAMGTVRFLQEAFAPKVALINGVHYNLQMFRSPNNRNLRTFYPEFVKMDQPGN